MRKRANLVTLVQGDDVVFNVGIEDAEGYPVDLSGTAGGTAGDGIYARFRKTDGTLLEKNTANGVALISGPKGLITVTLNDAETKLLKIGEAQDWEIQYDIAGKSKHCPLVGALTVRAALA